MWSMGCTIYRMTKIPEIRIEYGWLLTDNIAEPMLAYYDPGSKLREFEEYEAIAAQYAEWWKPHEQKILAAMCEVTGLEFKQNIIDVYVVPFMYAFSDPLVLGVKHESEEKLVSVLTHELIHRLLTDNTTHDDKKTLDEWTELFGEHDFVTLVHIPVHAVMHEIFLEKFDMPKYLEQEVIKKKSYRDSWEYVQNYGYANITQRLRGLYATHSR